ncbi:unnamed protein product [Rotaria sp. Silwood2]|nr:unnamed protein product [Rotaria sp. Silwood2]CAF4582887.1 unnamed protein product [Rotaria sp. Silwood2]
MSEEYKLCRTQLRQLNLAESVFTAKLLFYIKTCSFYFYSYLIPKVNHFLYTADEIIHYLSKDYLEIIHVHSHTVALWSKELLNCIAQLLVFRLNTTIRDTIVCMAEATLNDEIALRGYGILREVLTDDQLKDLKIADDNISNYFFNMLENAWKQSTKKYKYIPIVYLFRVDYYSGCSIQLK